MYCGDNQLFLNNCWEVMGEVLWNLVCIVVQVGCGNLLRANRDSGRLQCLKDSGRNVWRGTLVEYVMGNVRGWCEHLRHTGIGVCLR